jgi:hypothetical protein
MNIDAGDRQHAVPKQDSVLPGLKIRPATRPGFGYRDP